MSPGLIERWRALRARADAGVTLMELLVSMALTTILGTLTLMLFLNVNTSTAATTDRTITTASARAALEAWTADLQVADGTTAGSKTNRFEWLTGNDILFYADINNRSMSGLGTTSGPVMMWLRLDASKQLVEEQFASTAAKGATPTVCRVLATNVSQAVSTTGAAEPVFTPLDTDGNVVTGVDSTGNAANGLGVAPTPTTGCQKLPVTVPSQGTPDGAVQSNLANVRSVTIDFQVRDTRGGHPIEFTSQAVLPNLGSV